MADIRVGKPDTTLTSPAHIRGVKGGNDPGGYDAMARPPSRRQSDGRAFHGHQCRQEEPYRPE